MTGRRSMDPDSPFAGSLPQTPQRVHGQPSSVAGDDRKPCEDRDAVTDKALLVMEAHPDLSERFILLECRNPLVKRRMVALINASQDLLDGLRECAERLESAAIAGGSDKEYAALAVERYRAIIARAQGS